MDEYGDRNEISFQEKQGHLKAHIENREKFRQEQLQTKKKPNSIERIPEGPKILGYFNTGTSINGPSGKITSQRNSSQEQGRRRVYYDGPEFTEQIITKLRETITPKKLHHTPSSLSPPPSSSASSLSSSSPNHDRILSRTSSINHDGEEHYLYPLGIIGKKIQQSYQIVKSCIKRVKEEKRRKFVYIKEIYNKCRERNGRNGDEKFEAEDIPLEEVVRAIKFYSDCGEIVHCALEEEKDISLHLVFFDPGMYSYIHMLLNTLHTFAHTYIFL